MTLWLLLGTSALMGFGSALLVSRNRAAAAEIRAVYRKYGLRGTPLAVLLALVPLGNAVLWTVYAFHVQDWRFAAISWVPILCTWLAKMANHEIKPGSDVLR